MGRRNCAIIELKGPISLINPTAEDLKFQACIEYVCKMQIFVEGRGEMPDIHSLDQLIKDNNFMSDEKEYCVTMRLPQHDHEVMAWGHKTYCCSEDMDAEPSWHKVKFSIEIASYRTKSEIPAHPEESLLQDAKLYDSWECIDDPDYHLIGITKWKDL